MDQSETASQALAAWHAAVDDVEVSKEEARLHAYSAVRSVYDQRIREGRTQADIARAAKIAPARFSRLIKGPGNWTLSTLAAVLRALEAELRIEAKTYEDVRRATNFDARPHFQLPRVNQNEAVFHHGERYRTSAVAANTAAWKR